MSDISDIETSIEGVCSSLAVQFNELVELFIGGLKKSGLDLK